MNDYEQICKKLYEAKRCGCAVCSGSNIYECAYHAVKSYADGDIMLVRKLKGEMRMSDFRVYMSNAIAVLGAMISALNLYFVVYSQIVGEKSMLTHMYGLSMIAFVMFSVIYFAVTINKYKGVLKVGGYVQVAVEQLEKELSDK